MLLNVNNIRQLNARNEEMSYQIIVKSIEKFFSDLVRNYGILNQRYILIDSSYLPYQYLSISVIYKLVSLLEKQLGYYIIIQKVDNRTSGYSRGDLIQIYLFDPLDYSDEDVNVTVNSMVSQTIYSTFNGYNNIDGKLGKSGYLDCSQTKYII